MSGADPNGECPSCLYSLEKGECVNPDCPRKLKPQIHALLERYKTQSISAETVAKVHAIQQAVARLDDR